MILEGIEVLGGQTVFYPSTPAEEKKRFKPGHVVDINEHVKAVKVQFVVNIKHNRVRSEWFPVSILTRKAPTQ